MNVSIIQITLLNQMQQRFCSINGFWWFVSSRLITRDFGTSFLQILTSPSNVYFLKTCSLHYANVSVGTPSLSFLVALDTGSDLFWLPCDCSSCVHTLLTTSGKVSCSNETIVAIPLNTNPCSNSKFHFIVAAMLNKHDNMCLVFLFLFVFFPCSSKCGGWMPCLLVQIIY